MFYGLQFAKGGGDSAFPFNLAAKIIETNKFQTTTKLAL
jgi:hypothetical protein